MLSKSEQKEWASLRAKSKRHGISVRRVGPANVKFQDRFLGDNVYAQLGTGSATMIMDARIAVKKKRKKRATL